MIVKTEQKGDITIYYVEKDYPDNKLSQVVDHKLKPEQIKYIINDNADVYTTEGKLLVKFRKNKLNHKYVKDFYDNVIEFAKLVSTNRGSASGSKKKNLLDNPKVMSNILGYFDKIAPKQKYKFKQLNIPLPTINVRETRFLRDYPDKFKGVLPLIKQIDKYYEKYIPDKYKKQKAKAKQTPFRIADTAFTTITTNVNFQTAVHYDKGDDQDGFGNLAVIEKGEYEGGETCFPQYGIGINVRNYDVLYMDVHEAHGNLPIIQKTPDAIRLSIVCYLRTNIWKNTKGKTKRFMREHIQRMNDYTRKIHSH